MVSEEFSNLVSVGAVLVDTEFKVLSELLVELLEVLGILSDLGEHLNTLLGDGFLDGLEDLVLLERFSGNVKGKVI